MSRNSPSQASRPVKPEPQDRQIIQSVRHGRRCTFRPIDNDEITGYIAGIERFHYFVLSVEGGVVRQHLIHKSCPVIELHAGSTFELETEDIRAALTKIMGRFVQWAHNQCHSPLPQI